MSMTTAKFNYLNTSGNVCEGELKLEDYKTAAKLGMSVSGFLNAKYRDADPKYGTAWEQGLQNLGIHLKDDPARGIRATTIEQLMEGTTVRMAGEGTNIPGGTIVAPSGSTTSSPSTRVFFPEVILQTMQEKLTEDYSPEMAAWSSMIAITETIDSEVYIQPKVDVTNPRAERSTPISQNALPHNMVSITASDVSKAVPTVSIGLQISEQAQRRASIDLVTTILSQQSEGERYANLWSDISKVVSGNPDAGESALTATLGSTYDSGFTGGAITQTGWLKMLHDETRKINIDSIICDLDAFLAIQNRSGRPLVFDPTTSGTNTGNLGSYGLNVEPVLANFGLQPPRVMIVPTGTIPANHLLCFDSRYALRRVNNAAAQYQASESLVMSRTDVFRFDVGTLLERLRDEAFLYVDFS